MTTQEILAAAKAAKQSIAFRTRAEKDTLMLALADGLRCDCEDILLENQKDVEAAQGVISPVMIDRLRLDKGRIEAMAQGIAELVKLEDPVGKVDETVKRPNGLKIKKVRVPMGVVAIIYESRPNVTSDAAALCLKSGNVAVLRGGKEAYHSNAAIVQSLRNSAGQLGYNPNIISFVEDTTRASAKELMEAEGLVDLLIPRGGAGLIRACVEGAKVPCIQTGTGICHIYVDGKADLQKAMPILENAKTSRPSVCNACEVCLVDSACADTFLPMMHQRLATEMGVELRLCPRAAKIIEGEPAKEADFDTEFLDYTLAVKVVDGVEEAVQHIAQHSTGHSESIITEDKAAAKYFLQRVDSAAVYHNASTRFTDGGEFGLGCEIGIATQKVGARGPMGLRELTSYKYVIKGQGQIR